MTEHQGNSEIMREDTWLIRTAWSGCMLFDIMVLAFSSNLFKPPPPQTWESLSKWNTLDELFYSPEITPVHTATLEYRRIKDWNFLERTSIYEAVSVFCPPVCSLVQLHWLYFSRPWSKPLELVLRYQSNNLKPLFHKSCIQSYNYKNSTKIITAQFT